MGLFNWFGKQEPVEQEHPEGPAYTTEGLELMDDFERLMRDRCMERADEIALECESWHPKYPHVLLVEPEHIRRAMWEMQ